MHQYAVGYFLTRMLQTVQIFLRRGH